MNSHVTFLGLVTGMVLATFVRNPPATQVLMDSGSPTTCRRPPAVTTGGAIRWDNPTPTHHTVTRRLFGRAGGAPLIPVRSGGAARIRSPACPRSIPLSMPSIHHAR